MCEGLVNENLLDKLAEEIGIEWQMGGLFDGIYRDFAMELVYRYIRSVKKE